MATEMEAARLLVYQAAWMAERATSFLRVSRAWPNSSPGGRRSGGKRGVQIHGGYGFIKDFPAEKFYRDVKLCTIGEGTSEIQHMVIARNLLGKK